MLESNTSGRKAEEKWISGQVCRLGCQNSPSARRKRNASPSLESGFPNRSLSGPSPGCVSLTHWHSWAGDSVSSRSSWDDWCKYAAAERRRWPSWGWRWGCRDHWHVPSHLWLLLISANQHVWSAFKLWFALICGWLVHAEIKGSCVRQYAKRSFPFLTPSRSQKCPIICMFKT